jgi:hypothetical protein
MPRSAVSPKPSTPQDEARLLAKLQHLQHLQAELAQLEAERAAEAARAEALRTAQHLAPYRQDPVAFVHDLIVWPDGEGPAPYQDEILAELVARKRASVRGPHGLGKTAIKAWVVLWFALTRDGDDWKIPTTASAWYQLTHYLWPEIHKWSRRLDWAQIGRPPFVDRVELLDLSLKLATGEAFAIASSEPARIEGAHADHLLYLFDEAKAIPPDTFDAAEGAFSSEGEALALMASTPGEPNGRFYDVQSRKPGTEDWWVRHVTQDEVMRAGRMKPDWVEARGRQWGTGSAIFANRVLGEFASSEADGVIPLTWVEQAVERWKAWDADGRPMDRPLTALGVDVADGGPDTTVMALRFGDIVSELRRTRMEDPVQTAGRAAGILDVHGSRAPAIVDVIGVGSGVVATLRNEKRPVVAFNASEGTTRRDESGELGFINCRAAAWWHLREALDPAYGSAVALPPDDLLIGDLTAPHWKVVGKGLIQVESKDDIRKRLGRSTDDGDAVVQAFWSEGGPAALSSPAGQTLPKVRPRTPGQTVGRIPMVSRGGRR